MWQRRRPDMQYGARTSAKLRGYTNLQSVAQGESIQFCISNLGGVDVLRPSLQIFRLGLRDTPVASGVAIVRPQDVPVDRPWENNNWEIGYKLDVGSHWAPGIYAVRFADATYDSSDIFFIVRNSKPGSTTPIVVHIPTTTINAYNNWGGASLYAYNSVPYPTTSVSFDRPQCADSNWKRGYGFADEWNARMRAFVRWVEAVGYNVDFITSNDLHEDKGVLQHYHLFISIGHDEYWSREMRASFDAFVASGGNAAIFGGNTCYWQIRLESDERSHAACRLQVCYKDADKDPVEDPRLKTVTWREIGYPENRSFGAGFAAGAWKGNGKPAPFKVCEANHWVFNQTGLRENDAFGNTSNEILLWYETNGVVYTLDGRGQPVPTGTDGTPENYSILALAELPDWGTPGNAAMGIFTNSIAGGTIFNAATTDWARGLESCIFSGDPFRTITAKITRNVIEHLA